MKHTKILIEEFFSTNDLESRKQKINNISVNIIKKSQLYKLKL